MFQITKHKQYKNPVITGFTVCVAPWKLVCKSLGSTVVAGFLSGTNRLLIIQ